jgi:hypothetical protein
MDRNIDISFAFPTHGHIEFQLGDPLFLFPIDLLNQFAYVPGFLAGFGVDGRQLWDQLEKFDEVVLCQILHSGIREKRLQEAQC